MTDLRAVAERIAWSYMMSWPPDKQVPLMLGPTQYVSVIESILREVVAEAKSEVGRDVHILGLGERAERLKEARSEALEEVRKWVVSSEQCNSELCGHHDVSECITTFLDAKIRALKP